MASFPYDENDFLTQPTDAQRLEARFFRVEDWFTIMGIDSLRRHLYEGNGIVIGHEVLPDFDNLNPDNPVFDDARGVSRGAHAVTLIGYCDEKEAFKFINSWGTGWGLDGYGWISYELMTDTRVIRNGAAVGFVMEAFDFPIGHENYFDYTILDGGVSITNYIGPGGELVIPDTLAGYPVTAIGSGAFQRNRTLTGIYIPGTVITIGDDAFRDTSLANVVIGSGVAAIGSGAFRNSSLQSVVIPAGVASIGEGAFWGCRQLTGITVDAGNQSYKSIDGVLFDRDMTRLIQFPAAKTGEYTIPDGVTAIELAAFNFSVELTYVSIPDSMIYIGERAFANCIALTGITIPDSVEFIGNGAFSGCAALTDVTIGSGITSIGARTFYGCTSLTGAVIPDGVTSIGERAFFGCTSLTGVTIPESVNYIGWLAFHQDDDSPIGLPNFFPLQNLTIYCYENSFAHSYAIENGFPYVLLVPSITRPGDVNNDGAVNIVDLTLLRLHLAGRGVVICRANADVNGDGYVNRDDADSLRQYLAGNQNQPVTECNRLKFFG